MLNIHELLHAKKNMKVRPSPLFLHRISGLALEEEQHVAFFEDFLSYKSYQRKKIMLFNDTLYA